MPTEPYIPEYITVHLGSPNTSAQNVTVTFPDYIKNVASSEIYPSWPEAAVRANILAQISFALNRVYTEWYRSRGYDFDITNSTAYDQSFVNGRDIYNNVSNIVDEIFNSYIRRGDQIEPLFAAYCDGVEADCAGLKQVGTVTLANQGYSSLDILRYYYGSDINLRTDVPVQSPIQSYPGVTLQQGIVGNEVQQLQVRLNRISRNYPAIPKISPANGVFGESTTDAVTAFQQVFGLPANGVVDQATWYRIAYIYASVKRLAELDSEGLTQADIPMSYPGILRPGDTGDAVRRLQYYLAVIAEFYDTVRPVTINGIFDSNTENAVRDFQQTVGLAVDGIVGTQTGLALYDAYLGIAQSSEFEGGVERYPGEILTIGSRGEDVETLQTYLARIAQSIQGVPSVTVDGIFGTQTEAAVTAVQRLFGLAPDGVVGPLTWNDIASLYSDLTVGENKREGQFPFTIQ